MMDELTHREDQIFTRIAQGHSYKAIAAELSIETGTVANHVWRIYRKLRIHSKREARNLYNRRKERS